MSTNRSAANVFLRDVAERAISEDETFVEVRATALLDLLDQAAPHPLDDDLDSDGFGYWPEAAQAAVLRRDREIDRLRREAAR